MAKIDGKKIMNYLALGAGAVAMPALVAKVSQLASLVAKIPMWNTDLAGITTVGGLVLASAGVMVVDMLINK